MPEYIVSMTKSMMLPGFEETHERVIRCHDCGNCEITDPTKYFAYRAYEHDEEHLCHGWEDYEGTPAMVEPDGYCNLAVPREKNR